MDEVLMGVMIFVGAVLVWLASTKLKSRERQRRLPRKVFWQMVLMYVIGAGMIAAGFVIGGL